MKYWKSFLWLGEQAFDFMLHERFITISLLCLILFASALALWQRSERISAKHLLVFSPLLLSAVILFLGTIYRYPTGQGVEPVRWASVLVYCLTFLYLPILPILVYLMRGFRFLAFSIVLSEVWIGVWCSGIAGMSITGRWP